MRIAIAAETDHGLDGPTSSHFGQAAHFVLVDCEGGQIMDSRSVPNPFAGAHKHGQIPRFLKQEGIDAVLSGGMGAGAIAMFQRLGVTPSDRRQRHGARGHRAPPCWLTHRSRAVRRKRVAPPLSG